MKRNGTPVTNGARLTMTLDGEKVAFTRGETVYEVAERHSKEIPTLCYDPRLEPFGGCRLCVRRSLEGRRNRWPRHHVRPSRHGGRTSPSAALEVQPPLLHGDGGFENRDTDSSRL